MKIYMKVNITTSFCMVELIVEEAAMAEDNDISDREVANAINICFLSLLLLTFLVSFAFYHCCCYCHFYYHLNS